MDLKKYGFFLFILIVVLLHLSNEINIFANDNQQEDSIYDKLQSSMEQKWEKGINSIEADNPIPIEGRGVERFLRTITNFFYLNIVSIKAGSLIIGLFSFILGIIIACAARLNKKMRRFALSFLVITIPLLLFIFVFGLSLLISYYK